VGGRRKLRKAEFAISQGGPFQRAFLVWLHIAKVVPAQAPADDQEQSASSAPGPFTAPETAGTRPDQ